MTTERRDGADVSSWVVVYPVYLNSKKTTAEGRRMPLAYGCEDPTLAEIVDCCNHLKLACAPEPDKAYSRDFMQRGRVRVQLRSPGSERKPINPDIQTKAALLHRIAQLVPAHQGRRRPAATAAATAASSSKGGKGGKRKK